MGRSNRVAATTASKIGSGRARVVTSEQLYRPQGQVPEKFCCAQTSRIRLCGASCAAAADLWLPAVQSYSGEARQQPPLSLAVSLPIWPPAVLQHRTHSVAQVKRGRCSLAGPAAAAAAARVEPGAGGGRVSLLVSSPAGRVLRQQRTE
eukprot:220054-Chlamydomonas_euryale.AAC.3